VSNPDLLSNTRHAPARSYTEAELRRIAGRVADPEIPVISIDDLGILRDVTVDSAGRVEVTLTPTYSGCPAMDEIAADVRQELAEAGVSEVTVRFVLSPAWTTEMISPAGRRALEEYGIAPPGPKPASGPVFVTLGALTLGAPRPVVTCPQCGSSDTGEISHFGSTACKALYRCNACLEPFDYFKAL
jgi:ring-1,2-phenylacetyl-CoA epoxidase subunit PaaD